jgi:hypothetical protein
MQHVADSPSMTFRKIIFFVFVLLFAYLPVSSFLFFLKNDAFTVYFPPKFLMSEIIQSGHMPLWNPYINYGVPFYGDMSFGYWHPFTWIIAATVGYNAWSFTIEVLLYLLISGIGMYKLSSKFISADKICLIAGVAYMCCGYNVGHLQHTNWLSGAAFLPWCLWSYMNLQERFSAGKLLIAALAFYSLISAAHPGITIAAFYFFAAFAIYSFISAEKQLSVGKRVYSFAKTNVSLIIAVGLLSAGMIIGYMDIIPHFTRGEKVALHDSLLYPTTFQSWISFILPLATNKEYEFFATDIAMRNVYLSLTLLIVLLSSFFRRRTKLQNFLLFTGITFLLLSAGGVFKEFAYNFLPFIGYVRLNGEFRIFSLLCFVLLASIELDKIFRREKKDDKPFYLVYYVLEVLLAAAIAWGLYRGISSGNSLLYKSSEVLSQSGFVAKFKMLIDSLSIYDAVWIQAIIQLLVLWRIKWCLRNNNSKILLRVCVADIILATLMNVPFTGAGQASVAKVQSIINRSPAGIPEPRLQPIAQNDTSSVEQTLMIGSWSFYNKQPGTIKEVPYPIRLNAVTPYLDSLERGLDSSLMKRPIIFIEDEAGNVIHPAPLSITNFSNNEVEIDFFADDGSRLVYQQTVYPHWEAYINGQKIKWKPYQGKFLSVDLMQGVNTVVFRFKYNDVIIGMIVSLIALSIFIVSLLLLRLSNSGARKSSATVN